MTQDWTPQDVRAHLHGGPKDGWVYEVPTHGALSPGRTFWQTGLPPQEIVTPIGTYQRRPWAICPDGGFDYDWQPK